MPIEFFTDKGKEVSFMSNNRAKAFAGVSNGIAEAFSMPRPIIFDGEEDHFVINEEEFCALVEFAFTEKPLEVMFGWAEKAAGIYQSIKGQRYEWHWPKSERPVNCPDSSVSTLLEPMNTMEFVPKKHSGQKIEPPPYK